MARLARLERHATLRPGSGAPNEFCCRHSTIVDTLTHLEYTPSPQTLTRSTSSLVVRCRNLQKRYVQSAASFTSRDNLSVKKLRAAPKSGPRTTPLNPPGISCGIPPLLLCCRLPVVLDASWYCPNYTTRRNLPRLDHYGCKTRRRVQSSDTFSRKGPACHTPTAYRLEEENGNSKQEGQYSRANIQLGTPVA